MNRVLPGYLAVATLLLPVMLMAEDEPGFASRFSLSPRVALNISARFEGVGAGGAESSSRTTPNGDAYNYDDGYVLTDVSGNSGGQTWYWGYNDSAAQVSGNTILLSRSATDGNPSALSQNADLSAGAELVYNLQLGPRSRWRHGIEAAASYQNVHVSASGNFPVTVTTVTDAYSFTAGSTPPGATPGAPYQGTYQGPGFLINSTPSSSTTMTTSNVTLSTQNELQSALWGFRLGPYVEYAVSDRVSVALSGGVAAGVLDARVSWNESAGSAVVSGSDGDVGVLMGFYVSGTLSWRFAERWSLLGGIQYENLGTYEHAFNDRPVQLDLNNTFFATVGLGWSF